MHDGAGETSPLARRRSASGRGRRCRDGPTARGVGAQGVGYAPDRQGALGWSADSQTTAVYLSLLRWAGCTSHGHEFVLLFDDEIAVHVERVEQSASASERLRGLIEVLATLNGHVDRISSLFEEAQHLDEAFGRDWRNRVRGTRDYIRATVERVAADHGLSQGWDVENATDLVFAVTSLGTWRELTRDLGWSHQQFVHRAHGWAGPNDPGLIVLPVLLVLAVAIHIRNPWRGFSRPLRAVLRRSTAHLSYSV